jgi:signal transduction histidine kinase
VVNQRNFSRQKQTESYWAELALVRERVDSLWEKRAAEMGREGGAGSAASAFARCVCRGLADTVLILDAHGSLAYPQPVETPALDPLQWDVHWLRARRLESSGRREDAAEAYAKIASEGGDPARTARAVQAQARCLLRAGKPAMAASLIAKRFGGGQFAHALDPGGRLIAADELLLALRLAPSRQDIAAPTAGRLTALLNDYDEPLPAAQRLFLMNELQALYPTANFPTHAAETLAGRFAEKYRAAPLEGGLQASGIPDLWMLTAPAGRVLALYSTAAIQAALAALPDRFPGDPRFSLLPPNVPAANPNQLLPVGARLPGWQVALTSARNPIDDLDRKQTVAYLWIGILAAVCATLAGLYAAQALNRQWRVARLKTDLVAAVSHELKTPLAGMRLLVDTLLDDEQLEPRKTREYLELISHENLRLSRLIENFLAFSRLERNRQHFEFRPTSPATVAEGTLTAIRERLQTAGCRLDFEIAPELPLVHADEDAMITVLLNLLDNAYKYSPGEKHVTLRISAGQGAVTFAVEDRGIGIAQGETKKIFRRFYQVDRRLSREVGGVGLGLSIVEFIVRAHGGSVEVKSRPGQGSTFLVSLPARESRGKDAAA